MKAADGHGTRAKRSSIIKCSVPADGTSAASGGTEDFGTSPVFGQLSDKPLLARTSTCGVWDSKSNGGPRNYGLIQFDDGVVRQ